ncbi:uncharacterized protein Z518_07888 [Rhinocladiella mackenziei CBS 650.93]|uniref:Phosphoribosylaminoimidazole-succinocarboxamide synthase n=1 Tax=Rhinocladiella mackenziei CBS 650.93 TaxID=1442369 RepID=A0A0D2I7Y3_9EURO|nr:uncharacterized protein Z518_07888 [Rhinocladiella mackenziei CBS 650.93]KIX01949.1 hypothetical protein Z518_07888 [Rhinocladiella mackenziei CBS 650.93]
MNLDQDTHIQTVKSTTPQYLRSESLKSSSASNEYFSDYASDAVSQKSNATRASYETPPSRISTPIVRRNPVDSEMTLPARPGVMQPAPLHIRHDQDGGPSTVRMLSNFDEMSPPTPGVDDTPYIRFAIEQLTRDEDVTGRGRHSTATPDRAGSPILPPAEPEPAEDANASTPSPPPTPPQQPASSPRPPSQTQRKPVPQEFMIPVDLSKDLRSQLGFVPLPLRLPVLLLYLSLCLLMIAALIFNLIFVSGNHGLYDYDGDATPRYFVFQYLPQLLGIILILWLFVIEAAVYRCLPYFCMAPAHRNQWVLQEMRILPSNYLLPDLTFFRTRERLLGVTFLIFWLTGFTVPLLSCVFQTQWITDDGPARFRWTTVRGVGWTLVALYILLCSGIMHCMVRFRRRHSSLLWDPCSLADLICLFRRSNVGADFEQTEVSPEPNRQIPPKSQLRLGFWTTSERPDVFHAVGEEYAPVKRLSFPPPQPEKPSDGLLHPPNDAVDVEAQQRHSYGSAFARNIHSPFVRYRWTTWFLRDSAVLAWIIAAILLIIAFLVVSFVNNAVQDGFDPLLPSITDSSGFSPANFLYSFLPAFLGMVLFLAWQPIDMYFRAVQPFCNLSRPAGADAHHSLLLSYPALGPVHVIVSSFLNHDYKVGYISFISLLSLSIPVLAGGVFTAQFFEADDQVRMVASMPGYIALCVLATIYALSYMIIWPTRKRYLPHNINTIAGLMSWLYASPLLGDGILQNVRTKADLIARLTGSTATPTTPTGDAGMDETVQSGRRSRRVAHRLDPAPGTRYAFGVFVGRDGKEHLGIDRLQRPGSREMIMVPRSPNSP